MTAPTPHGTHIHGLELVPRSTLYQGRFGRMFRNLPPHVPPSGLVDQLAEAMIDKRPGAKPGGAWDGSAPEDDGGDNPRVPAIYTYLGQFLDHDVTFDTTSSLQRRNDPNALHNFRTPRLDLDSVYGGGPDRTPYLYDVGDPDKLLLEEVDGGFDLPRNSQDRALIGDPRNDVHSIIAQLHRVFIRLHNHFVDTVRSEGSLPPGQVFEEAQRRTSWHYQWIILHDYLPRIVGQEMVDGILAKPVIGEQASAPSPDLRFYHPKNQAFMPVEFSVAIFRMGHSMIRPEYLIRDGADPLPILAPNPEEPSLSGHVRIAADRQIQWHHLAEVEGKPAPTPSRRIDMLIADPLAQLPAHIFGDEDPPSLILRNLRRGISLGLPSGQDVARAMCVKPLDHTTFNDAATFGLDNPEWNSRWPLLPYVLAEAQHRSEGQQLGPVGGRIFAEVVIGLLDADNNSYLNIDPCWTPEATSISDLLELANEL